MTGRMSQCDLIAAVLADGEFHTTAEIHQRCGFSRLNSRIAELRSRRNMNIVGEHIAGKGTGPDAYRYRLIETPEATSGRACAELGPATSRLVASDAPLEQHDSPRADGHPGASATATQLTLEVAA